MNRKLLGGITLVALVTGGYYASAAGLPHVTLSAPKISGASYAPGTPNWLEYPGSPYRIGGPKGPKSDESWATFTAPHPVSTSLVNTSATGSASATAMAPATGVVSTHSSSTLSATSTTSTTPAVTLWHTVTIPLATATLTMQMPAAWAANAVAMAVPTGQYWAWGSSTGYQGHPNGFFDVHVMTESGPAADQTLPGPWPQSYQSSVESADAAQFGVAQSYAVAIDGQWVVIDITVPANHTAWLGQMVHSVRW